MLLGWLMRNLSIEEVNRLDSVDWQAVPLRLCSLLFEVNASVQVATWPVGVVMCDAMTSSFHSFDKNPCAGEVIVLGYPTI